MQVSRPVEQFNITKHGGAQQSALLAWSWASSGVNLITDVKRLCIWSTKITPQSGDMFTMDDFYQFNFQPWNIETMDINPASLVWTEHTDV